MGLIGGLVPNKEPKRQRSCDIIEQKALFTAKTQLIAKAPGSSAQQPLLSSLLPQQQQQSAAANRLNQSTVQSSN